MGADHVAANHTDSHGEGKRLCEPGTQITATRLRATEPMNELLKRNLYKVVQAPYAYIATVSGTFNSLFKVLCTFPSWYLSAIELVLVLRFRWNVPPT